jgi:hypothetical protein
MDDGNASSLNPALFIADLDQRRSRCHKIDLIVSMVFVSPDCASRGNNREIDEINRSQEISRGQEPAEVNRSSPAVISFQFLSGIVFDLRKASHRLPHQ